MSFEHMMDNAESLHPLSSYDIYKLVDDCFNPKQPVFFVKLLQKALNRAEDDMDRRLALNKLGDLYMEAKLYGDAGSAYQRIVDMDPEDAFALWNLATCLWEQGKKRAARELARKCRFLNPNIYVGDILEE